MITTLDELRQYFEHLDTLPPSEGRQDAEAALRPVLEAFGGWEDGHLGALLLHLGMTLATQRGQQGTVALQETLAEMLRILHRRAVIWGSEAAPSWGSVN